MDAAEENAEDHGDLIDVIARANLTDALLGLRERGLIRLTDDGFSLVDGGTPTDRPTEAETWLTRLVGQKLNEWHMRPATA